MQNNSAQLHASKGILHTQQALDTQKKQITSQDQVNNVSNLYYSLQRNIEAFESQLETQMKRMDDDGTKPKNLQSSVDLFQQDENRKLRNLNTRARDQYKYWRKSYPRKVIQSITKEDPKAEYQGNPDIVNILRK